MVSFLKDNVEYRDMCLWEDPCFFTVGKYTEDVVIENFFINR